MLDDDIKRQVIAESIAAIRTLVDHWATNGAVACAARIAAPEELWVPCYRMVNVRDIESDKARVTRAVFGAD